jgi:hypothetical protein
VTIGQRTSIAHRAIVHGPCAVGNGVHLPTGFYVQSTERVCVKTGLSVLPLVPADTSEFSEAVVRANNASVLGYKRIQNEF